MLRRGRKGNPGSNCGKKVNLIVSLNRQGSKRRNLNFDKEHTSYMRAGEGNCKNDGGRTATAARRRPEPQANLSHGPRRGKGFHSKALREGRLIKLRGKKKILWDRTCKGGKVEAANENYLLQVFKKGNTQNLVVVISVIIKERETKGPYCKANI